MAILMDGKALAAKLNQETAREVTRIVESTGKAPCLAAVLVGDDPASQIYVRSKERDCARAGIRSRVIRMSASTTQADLLSLVRELNRDDDVNGVLVQLPLPSDIDPERIVATIDPLKDVDGFHPMTLGHLFRGAPTFLPCTPAGVMDLIDTTGTDLVGRHAVIIGRSLIVGRPLAHLMLSRNMTVTICHSRTRNLSEMAAQADVLVAAVGRSRLVTADFVKPGAIVVDVGMNRLEDGNLTGDVDFAAVQPIAGAITPVPGGVGPMTRARLLKNVLEAHRLQMSASVRSTT